MASNPQPQPPPPPPPPPPPQQQPPLPGAAGGGGAVEPELVSVIVNHLKSQGLFDQFRRDCLADVDTKPAYQNLRQRVDNFVSNHLATHTWSPHLNKNQLRNNIRQQVLKSGMLESGIDRIISQVVDPKINHTFRPQVEKAVHEFLATLNHKEETSPSAAPSEEKADASITVQGVSATAPSTNVVSDAMSILETITSLNQEASAARASTENTNSKNSDRTSKRLPSQQSVDDSTERERNSEELLEQEKPSGSSEGSETVAKCEDLNDLPCPSEEIKNSIKDVVNLINPSKELLQESDDQKSKLTDRGDRKPEITEKGERRKEKKEKNDKKFDHLKKNDDALKAKEEKQVKEREVESVKQLIPEKNSSKQKITEGTNEEHIFDDSDVDLLSDITVSSVHTSDLSSFEEESEEEAVVSDSTEEGEITSDDEEEQNNQSKTKPQTNELCDGKAKPVRHAYVHKPFLYSKYYSDSDDERTVEQRRQSIAREKEERLLRRQINRERLEEKRKQKAAEKTKSLKSGSQRVEDKSGLNLEESSTKDFESKVTGTSIKDVLKEQKFLEKKVALSRKRKRDSRHVEDSWKKKCEHPEEDSKESQKTNETCEKTSSKELKHNHGKSEATKPVRRVSESVHSTEESKNDPKVEREHKRKPSTSLQIEGTQQDTETRDPKKQLDRAETGTDELQKQKYAFKNEKHLKKDDTDIQNIKSIPKKELKSCREKNEKERTLSEDKLVVKHRYKGDGSHKVSDDVDIQSFERSLKGEDNIQKYNQQTKVPLDDKFERKNKHRSERKISTASKDGKNVSEYTLKNEEILRKENNKKDRHISTEKSRAEYKSKRSSSDSRPQKDSQGNSKQPVSSSQRRSESYSEDKYEIESVNSDSNLKQEDSIHRDRRRSKSFLEDKSSKSKSKCHGKQSKPIEIELQESFTKHETGQKPDKDKNMEEMDTDKQRKSKNEDKVFEESIVDFELESDMHSIHSSQKDFSRRVKVQAGEKSVKEKYKSDKDLSCAKVEKKLSVEGQKSRNLKHSNKEMKKKEEGNKLEDKDIKEMYGSHEKVQGIVIMDKKSSKKLPCENKKGSLLAHEMTVEEEKLATDTFVTSHIPAIQTPVRTADDSLNSEQVKEPMEVDSEQSNAKVHEASKTEEKSSSNSLLDRDSENIAKENMNLYSSKNEFKNKLVDFEMCVSEFTAPVDRNSEQSIEHEKNPIKGVDVLDAVFRQASEEQGPIKQGAYQMNIVYETSGRILLNAPIKEQTSEDARQLTNFNNIVNPIEENVSLAIHSSRQDASHKKSMDMYFSDFTDPLPSLAKEESRVLDKIYLNKESFNLDNNATQIAHMEQGSPVQGCVMKESEVTMVVAEEKDSETHLIGVQVVRENMGDASIHEDDQVTMLNSVQGRNEYNVTGETEGKSLMTNQTADHTGISMKKSVLMKERGNLNIGPAAEQEKDAIVDVFKKSEGHDMGATVDSSLELVSMNAVRLPEEIIKDSVVHGTEEGDDIIDTEDKNESSAVGTSAGSVDHIYNRLETTEATVIGTSTEKMLESTVMATSTGEGEGECAAMHSEKESDATTTCSEEESEVTLICTSIEADEGLTASIWANSNEGVSFSTEADGECTVAAAEESGGGVTGGFAESESFLTSTKEGESGECTMIYTEENGKDSVNAGRLEIEDNVNSAGTEEKDDAVTSAGSEEKCKTSTCRHTDKFEGSVTCISEVESDGAVTSAGTDAGEGSRSINSLDEFQNNVTGAGQLKESEGAVTCTGAEERGDGFIIGSVTCADAQEDSAVTGACVKMSMDKNTMTGTSADKGEDAVNGESAVTSTGITTEDDAEIATVCTELEDSNEGFAVGLDVEKCESAMDSTGPKEEATIPMISIGPCDDEAFVTSTGAKEEDEEGEGIVTSTGRENEEIENASTCTGIEGESALICIGAEESESSIICIVAEQVEAKSGMAATNINKDDGVDSNTGAKKEANGGIISKRAKGIVESSVTSASIADEDALIPNTEKDEDIISIDVEEYEDPMTSAVTEKDKGQFAAAAKEENDSDANGSHGSECEGAITHAVANEVEFPPASTERVEKTKGDVISTSTVEGDAPIPCSATEVEEGSLTVSRTDENESTVLLDNEEFEAPMPSTATEFKDTAHTASSKQAKDECTMISTSIMEECEAPMSSAAMEYDSQFTATRTEEVNESTVFCIGMEIYEVAMPSASSAADDQNHPAASSKEKDECAMISTSIMEEQVILMSSEATEDRIPHLAAGTKAKSDTSIISTSMEYFEAPTPSAATQDEDQLTASETEGRLDAAIITRSGTKECDMVLISAATQAESPLIAIETEEKDEGSMNSPNVAEEPKVVDTSATRDERCELTAINPEGKNGGSMTFVRDVVECGAPVLKVASSNEDQHVASSIENKEEGTVIALSTMEDCDSLFTFAVIEESQLIATNTEVKDENDVLFNSSKETECVLSSTRPEKSDSSLPGSGREGDNSIDGGEREIHENAVMGKSVVAKITADADDSETAETTVNLMSVNEALCMEISTGSTVIVSPSTEMAAGSERADEYIPNVDATSKPCIPSEETMRNDNFENRDYNVNSSLLESDFSETRTSLPRAQTLSLISEHVSKLTVNTNQGEITVDAKLGEKSDIPVSHMDKQFENDGKRNTTEAGDDLGIKVSFQQNRSFHSDKKETLPSLAKELERKTNSKTEEKSRSPTREEPHEESHTEYLKDLPLKNAALKKDSIDVENSDTHRVDECSCKERKSKSSVTTSKETAQETSNTMDMIEAEKVQIKIKDQEIEITHREKVCSMPGMGKKQSPAHEGESDDWTVTQDLRKGNKPSQCSRIKDTKEVTSGDIPEVSKEIIRKRTLLSSAVEEKDEFISEQDTCEKAKQNLETNLSSVEENQTVIVKRKRGRPRKYPLEAVQNRVDSEADINTGNVQPSPTFATKGKFSQTAKDTSNKKETSNEGEAGKAEMIVRRRGRKPKCSVIPSEETETLEPEKKRRKLASASEDEVKEQEEDDEDDADDDDEAHSGATTRSATRLEAQRKQPSKPTTRAASKGNSPSSVSPRKHQNSAAKKRLPSEAKISKSPPLAQLKMQAASKRKREASPPVVRRKGQLKVDETPLKKAKR